MQIRISLFATIFVALAVSATVSQAREPDEATVQLDHAQTAFSARDYSTALDTLLPLAEAGNAEAQTRIGFMFRTGLLGIPDFDEAARWFELAVAQDHPGALFNMGLMFFQFEVMPPDVPRTRFAVQEVAFERFSQAAELGHPEAQLYLGHMYAEGLGVFRDPVQAYKWYQLAAWQRNSLAVSARDSIARRITAAELDTAKAEAETFQAARDSETQ
jgi:TPR repeat protein